MGDSQVGAAPTPTVPQPNGFMFGLADAALLVWNGPSGKRQWNVTEGPFVEATRHLLERAQRKVLKGDIRSRQGQKTHVPVVLVRCKSRWLVVQVRGGAQEKALRVTAEEMRQIVATGTTLGALYEPPAPALEATPEQTPQA
jgi:hypothetical protein